VLRSLSEVLTQRVAVRVRHCDETATAVPRNIERSKIALFHDMPQVISFYADPA